MPLLPFLWHCDTPVVIPDGQFREAPKAGDHTTLNRPLALPYGCGSFTGRPRLQ
jgi:hypothetical protein